MQPIIMKLFFIQGSECHTIQGSLQQSGRCARVHKKAILVPYGYCREDYPKPNNKEPAHEECYGCKT